MPDSVSSGVSATPRPRPTVTGIVTCYNEEPNIGVCIESMDWCDEIIVVDGHSRDDTVRLASPLTDRCLVAGPGRAAQLNAGARVATGDLLLFLHADTTLPDTARDTLMALQRKSGEFWGRFDVTLDSPGLAFRMIATLMNARSRLTGIATGDQAIFIDATVFHSLGGFPIIPLMEDVAFCKRLRHLHAPFSSKSKVITSARRWMQNGIINTVLTMWWYRLAFFFGISPTLLKKGYGDVR